jgi:hypothetical protein
VLLLPKQKRMQVLVWDPCACEGEGAEEGGDAAPRDATVPGARAPLDVGGRAARGAL